jgi:hypothetical protein
MIELSPALWWDPSQATWEAGNHGGTVRPLVISTRNTWRAPTKEELLAKPPEVSEKSNRLGDLEKAILTIWSQVSVVEVEFQDLAEFTRWESRQATSTEELVRLLARLNAEGGGPVDWIIKNSYQSDRFTMQRLRRWLVDIVNQEAAGTPAAIKV